MKKSYIRLIALIFVTAIMSCSKSTPENNSGSVIENPTVGLWGNAKINPIHFELEEVYGGTDTPVELREVTDEPDVIFPAVWSLQGPVVDKKGNMYVINKETGKMLSFAADGSLRWKKGQKGKGPGDFNRPRGLVSNGKYLFTANISGSRIDKFDFDGNLVSIKTIENLELGFATAEGFIDDSLLVLSSTLWGKLGQTLTVLNVQDSLEKISQFKVIASPDIELGEGLSSSSDVKITNSLIVVGNQGVYGNRFFNWKGEKVKTVKRAFDKLVRPGFYNSGGSRGIGGFGGLDAPLYISENYYLVQLSWPVNVADPDEFVKQMIQGKKDPILKNSLDFYRADGTLLYSIVQDGSVSKIGTIAYVDLNGDMYTKANNPFPQIRRYSVTITPPDN